MAWRVTPTALISAAATKKLHRNKYGRNNQATYLPICLIAPSIIVQPVASCHLAMPSVNTNLKTPPTTTAQSTATPNMLPAKPAVARSPAATPVAATSKPGNNIFIFDTFIIYLQVLLKKHYYKRISLA